MIKKIILAVLLIATVLWLGFIFSNSLDTAEQSSEKSSTVSEVVNKVAEKVGIEEEIPEKTIREMAHFSEFALLSVLICADIAVFLTLVSPRSLYTRSTCVFLSLPVCSLLAFVDELLQKTSDGRASQLSDVLLDTLGATCGVLASLTIYIICDLLIKRKLRKS